MRAGPALDICGTPPSFIYHPYIISFHYHKIHSKQIYPKLLHFFKTRAIINSERGRLEKRPFWMPALVGIEPVSLCLNLLPTKVKQL